MSGRLHELPPRSRPLAVVLDPAPVACVDEDAWYRAQLAWFTADFKGNPWTLRGCVVGDDALFDDAAARSGFPVATGAVIPPRGRLWEPSDNVARWLPAVEARMAHRWGRGGRLLEGAASSAASSEPASSEEGGVGTGRSRRRRDPQMPGVSTSGAAPVGTRCAPRCGGGGSWRWTRTRRVSRDAPLLAEAHGVGDRVAPSAWTWNGRTRHVFERSARGPHLVVARPMRGRPPSIGRRSFDTNASTTWAPPRSRFDGEEPVRASSWRSTVSAEASWRSPRSRRCSPRARR